MFNIMNNKKILVFGGSGSLGYEITKQFVDHNEIYNFSRDECKHWNMKLDFNHHSNLNFIIGDIINKNKVTNSIIRINPDIIIIAAAMKHVDQCEINAEQCINTNMLGVKNILDCIELHKDKLVLKTTLFVSTDKACSPINTYGMTKAISEQLMIEKAYYIKSIKFVNIRYGNVLNSRGSIIPLLHNIGNDDRKEYFNLTHKDMTRFVMTLKQSVELIQYAILNGYSGETIIPELISMKLIDLLEIFSEKYNKPIRVTSIRPGEKMLESLINPTQAGRVIKKGSYYHIKSIFDFKETIDDNKLIDYNSKINPLTKKDLFLYLQERNLL
jgi:UDP-N-acetylglucosamine 4,6-dehydratase/5-epimerase